MIIYKNKTTLIKRYKDSQICLFRNWQYPRKHTNYQKATSAVDKMTLQPPLY